MKFLDVWTHWLPKREQGSGQGEKTSQEVLLSPQAGRLLAALAVFGALLLLLSRTPESDQAAVSPPDVDTSADTALQEAAASNMEQELQTILSRIAQAGNVWVYITMETSAEKVIAEEITRQVTVDSGKPVDKRESRRPVTVRDDALKAEQPIVLVQVEPKVRGVVIVADGAVLPHVKYQLAKAAQIALGLPAHRVSVFAAR
ncbi:MAG TPA: hypothetical protein GXZ82_08990 [Firmicutes bacterium]|jgi:stage III sporulation protein AG|nr:hypothetical protein [Bacillota bacterium]